MTSIEQGTEEWFKARCGKVTASRVSDVVAKTRNGWGASRANYAAQLIAERLTGKVADSFSSAAMQWGTDTEPEARDAYEFYTGLDVVQIGFVDHPKIQATGASPDGMVGETGLIEIKCPNTATHINTLISQSIPKKYITQMHWQMACTGRDWCDFVSYDPRMPEELRMFMKRVDKDAELTAQLEGDVCSFLTELEETIAKLQKLTSQAEPAQ